MSWFWRRQRRAGTAVVRRDPWDTWYGWDLGDADDEDDGPDRSLLEIEDDPEMRAAQAEVDAEPLTPRSPPPEDPYSAW